MSTNQIIDPIRHLERIGVSAVARRDYDLVNIIISSLRKIGLTTIDKRNIGIEETLRILGVVGRESIKNDMVKPTEDVIQSFEKIGLELIENTADIVQFDSVMKVFIDSLNEMGATSKTDNITHTIAKVIALLYIKSLETRDRVLFNTSSNLISSLQEIGLSAVRKKFERASRSIITDLGEIGESTLRSDNLQHPILVTMIVSALRILGVEATRQYFERSVTLSMLAFRRIMITAFERGYQNIIDQCFYEMGVTCAESLQYDFRESISYFLRVNNEICLKLPEKNMSQALLSGIEWLKIIGINLADQLHQNLLFKDVRKARVDDILKLLNEITMRAGAFKLENVIIDSNSAIKAIMKVLE
ncbi:MAG: hypothetical protein ACW98W_12625 [Candidatus Hodarchaeales archaeon]|jgi:hypothetical protein